MRAPGWQTAGPAPRTGLSAGPVCLPPHPTPVPRGSARLSPLPSRPGLSPILSLTQRPRGGPRECHLPAGVSSPGRTRPLWSQRRSLLLCVPQRLERARRVGFSGAAVHSQSSAAGPASAPCALRRWTHPWGERLEGVVPQPRGAPHGRHRISWG